VDGKIKPDVLMHLGRIDRLDVGGLLGLAASIREHFGDGPDGSGGGDDATSKWIFCSSTPPRPTSSAMRKRMTSKRFVPAASPRTPDDLPQIIIGLAVTRESIPVPMWCRPGQTNDQSVSSELEMTCTPGSWAA
jgi:hypothetical protein